MLDCRILHSRNGSTTGSSGVFTSDTDLCGDHTDDTGTRRHTDSDIQRVGIGSCVDLLQVGQQCSGELTQLWSSRECIRCEWQWVGDERTVQCECNKRGCCVSDME